ncbi:hypothetical protein BN946_scf184815.g43 [Trametes cinnabarina]|uniref:Uncharacterized protein n=1 Tax=Pycnoporus cinnabarinus TaxID=5643 RepID=A0A060S2M1_PYCCI|nr:hypothetical protein BN946_scf184815.g43 [Trametes cinnabarina]
MPLDHFGKRKDTFKNRYWVNDTYYKTGGPVFLFDSGEQNAEPLLPYYLQEYHGLSATMRLAQRYNGVAILWEHRYYGDSLPFPENTTADQWQFLTTEQALEDVVYFANRFSLSADGAQASADSADFSNALHPSRTPWIWLGGSYPGVRGALLRVRNPDTIFAVWASSAPVHAQVDMAAYYKAAERSLTRNCSADWVAVTRYVDNTLQNGTAEEVADLKYRLLSARSEVSKERAANASDVSAAGVLMDPLSFYQYYGFDASVLPFCNVLETRNSTITPFETGLASNLGIDVALDAFLTAIQEVNYDAIPGNPDDPVQDRSWMWQYCSEYGFYQRGDPNNPWSIETSFRSLELFQAECNSAFPRGLPPSPAVQNVNKYGGWNMTPSNVLFTNGEFDPWRTMGLASIESNSPMRTPSVAIPRCNVAPEFPSFFGLTHANMVHVSDLRVLLTPDANHTDFKTVGFYSPVSQEPFYSGLGLFGLALDEWLPCFGQNSEGSISGAYEKERSFLRPAMAHFPYTRLILGEDKALAVTGHHFHVLNAHTGEIVHSTTHLDNDTREKLTKTGPVRCAAVNATFTHAITTGDDKKLKVWQVGEDLKLLSERDLPKKPTEIGFTRDGQTIVVSDKFGDVFSYPLHPDPVAVSSTSLPGASKRGSLTAHENPSNGTLILGHASMLTTYLLTSDEQYIITADRDEHIRVSWFPKGYVIERYCLGHEKFVSALHVPSYKPSTLVSGGGDPMLKVWDWMSGKLLSEINVFDAVEPFIKVKAPKWRKPWHAGDDDDDERGSEGKSKGKGKDKRRGQGKQTSEEAREQSADAQQQQAGSSDRVESVTQAADVVMTETRADRPAISRPANESSEAERLVFAVHRIQSVDRGEHGRFVLFSAVGTAAVIYAPLPQDGENLPASSVQAVDLGKPVIDFSAGQDGNVWVLLDAEWGPSTDSGSPDVRPVHLLSWQGATLSEVPEKEPSLLSSLNTKISVSATPAELKTLDLYSPLTSLPKNVDPEHDPLIRDTLSEAAAVASLDGEGKQLTQRELGRLKKKKALLAKIQEQEQQKRSSREGTAAATEGEGEAGREVKRARSESTGEGAAADDGSFGTETRDVEMSAS